MAHYFLFDPNTIAKMTDEDSFTISREEFIKDLDKFINKKVGVAEASLEIFDNDNDEAATRVVSVKLLFRDTIKSIKFNSCSDILIEFEDTETGVVGVNQAFIKDDRFSLHIKNDDFDTMKDGDLIYYELILYNE